MSDEVLDLHRRALAEFGRRVHAVGTDQWGCPTPCKDWEVRLLVNHLVAEQLWVPPLLAGKRVADLGDGFATGDVLGAAHRSSAVIERGLVELKELPFVANVRGERGGMVWGVEARDHGGRTAAEWANALVLAGYQGDGPAGDGVHLLGPLAKKVVRVAPPLVITPDEAAAALALLHRAARRLLA